MKGAQRWSVVLLMLFGMSVSWAETIELPVRDQVMARADYQAGEKGRPAVLILHGFLQTREFSTVRRLGEAVHEWGYSVLSPTLSLGIDARLQSLPCEAIHTHDMEQSVQELRLWVEWLVSQGHEHVILVGHSAGSATQVAYLDGTPHPAVRQAILLSLVAFGPGPLSFETEAHAEAARAALAEGGVTVGEYAMAFCRQYPATPASFLSYYDWSRARIGAALRRTQIPVQVVIGSADQRMTPEWVRIMQESPAEVVVIEGANHFFHDVAEFDLLDVVGGLLP